MYRLSFLAIVFFSAQVHVLATSMHSTRFVIDGWEPYFCMEDNAYSIGLPLFIGPGYADSVGMSVESCAAFCDSQSIPYRFMGITDGFICSCDNFFEYIYETEGGVDGGDCNKQCGVEVDSVGCGGLYMASVYQKVDSNFIIPALVPSVGLWNGLGCHNDSVSARGLQVMVDAGNTTVESCVAACQAQEFSLAGVEYGRECWCGSQLQHGSMYVGNGDGIEYDATTQGIFRPGGNIVACNMACEGNISEICGGPALFDLYNFTGTYPIGASVVPEADGWTSRGCYSDLVSSRTLERRVDVDGGMTVELCIPACQEQSFTIAGLEYAQECWCGNEINSPGAPISQSACSQVCVGNSTEVCGGPNALQLYY